MLKRFWFKLDRGDGYGVTAHSRSDAESLLAKYGYPSDTQRVVEVVEGVSVRRSMENRCCRASGRSWFGGFGFLATICDAIAICAVF